MMNFLDVKFRFDDPSQYGLAGSLTDNPPVSSKIRSNLLANAIKITHALFPSLAEGLSNLGQAMMLKEEVDCFVVANPEIQAYCVSHQSCELHRFTVVISSALIERLNIDEVRFVIGHEVGHFLCGHWRYPELGSEGRLGERLALLRLSRAAEISADRIGMLACGSLEHSCAAMIKVAAGLGAPHLQPDIPSILLQFRELTSGEGTESAIWTTHPIIPLRVKSLLRFQPIWKSIRTNGDCSKVELTKIDDAIEADFHKSSGFALQRISDKHIEAARTWGIVSLFAADGVITKAEQHLMIENLGYETTTKVLKYLKLQGSSIKKSVDLKLVDACDSACLIPLEDRKKLIADFFSIVDHCGANDPKINQALERISTLLDV